MNEAQLIYFILFQLSLFAIGAAAVAVGVCIRHRFHRWWAYTLTKVSLSGIIGVILTRVWSDGQVEPSGVAYFYVALVAIGALGMAAVSGDLAKRGGKQSAELEVAGAKPSDA